MKEGFYNQRDFGLPLHLLCSKVTCQAVLAVEAKAFRPSFHALSCVHNQYPLPLEPIRAMYIYLCIIITKCRRQYIQSPLYFCFFYELGGLTISSAPSTATKVQSPRYLSVTNLALTQTLINDDPCDSHAMNKKLRRNNSHPGISLT